MPTVAEAADRSRKVYLNDASIQLYSTDTLLPFIQQAYGEIQLELTANGIQVTKETSAVLSVAAGANPLITVNEINDLVIPIELFERAVGESLFIPMTKLAWEPEMDRTETLRFWNWRENEIKLLGSTAIREVKVRYIKGLPALVNQNTSLAITGSLEFLAARAAGLASRFIGGNNTRADACDIDAGRILPRLVAIEIKATQSISARRKPFRYRNHIR